MASSRNMDMLHGPIWLKMIIFALPLAFTGVLQQLFNAADVAVLGRYVSSDAMAAVGNNVPVIGLVVSLFMGLSLGANVVVARFIGMKDEEQANVAVHTAITLAIVFGVAITLLGELCAGLITDMLDVPEAVAGYSEEYLRVYLAGMPFMAVYNFLAAIFRSKGDTQTPLFALAVASLFNIAADLFFVLVCGMSAGGVALATVLANLLAAVMLFRKQMTLEGALKLVPGKLFHMDRRSSRAVIRVGMPAAIQGMVFSLSNLIVQSAINSLGPDAMAGSVAAFTIEINVYCFINAFGLAATTFVSQNYGAGDLARCRRVTWISMGLNFAATFLLISLVYVFSDDLLGFFSSKPEVIALGLTRVLCVVMSEPINVIMETTSDAMRGYGYSMPPALVTLFCICTIRVIWIYTVFSASPDYLTLMLVYPVSWIITAAALALLYWHHQRKVLPLKQGF